MADKTFAVSNNGDEDHLTPTLGNAAVEADQGLSIDFVDNVTMTIKSTATPYGDELTPSSLLQPTGSNKYRMLGVAGTNPKPKWVRGAAGELVTLNYSNWVMENLDMETDGAGCFSIGQAATANDGIIKDCLAHGKSSSTASFLIRLRSLSNNINIFNNILSDSTTGGGVLRIESADHLVASNAFINTGGGVSINNSGNNNNEVYFNSMRLIPGIGVTGGVGVFVVNSAITGTKIKSNAILGGDYSFRLHPGASGLELDFNNARDGFTADYEDRNLSVDHTLASWKAMFGSLSQSSLSVDPLYKGPLDLRLQSASLLIGAGVTVVGQTLDFFGNLRKVPNPAMGFAEPLGGAGRSLGRGLGVGLGIGLG